MEIKKVFKGVLFLALLVAVLCFHISEVSASGAPIGDGTEASPYQIRTMDELYWFANEVNCGNNTIHAKLMNNIIVNENLLDERLTLDEYGKITEKADGIKEWMPIGNIECKYQGTFNGGHYTISGLYYNDDEYGYYGGMFGVIGESGRVKYLTIEDSYFTTFAYLGSISGLNEGTIDLCYNYGVVYGSECIDSEYVGGISGSNSGVIEWCRNYAPRVNGGWSCTGGICGENTGELLSCFNYSGYVAGIYDTGGVCGTNEGEVESCDNYGEVGATVGAGGISGSNFGEISGCDNAGKIGSSEVVGGICGYNYENAIIICCINSGEINGDCIIGGICGDNNLGVIIKCGNTGNIEASGVMKENYSLVGGICGTNQYIGDVKNIINCSNAGRVSGTSYYVGGIVGRVCNEEYEETQDSIVNCYYLEGGAIDGNGTVQYGIGAGEQDKFIADISGSTVSKREASYKSGEVAYLLNQYTSSLDTMGYMIWGQKIGEEEVPVIDSKYASRIHMVYKIENCIGGSYSNVNVAGEHSFERDAICSACGTMDKIESITLSQSEKVRDDASSYKPVLVTISPNYPEIKLVVSSSDESVIEARKYAYYDSVSISEFVHNDGTAVITVATEDGSISASYTVTVDISKCGGVDYSDVYDYAYYTSKYSDIVGDMGTVAAMNYFVNTGMFLGHQASAEFNPEIYKCNYSDLAELYGDDYASYYTHYMTIGKVEGLNGATLIDGADGVVDFVNRMYSIILEREPDAGSQTWVDLLKDGEYTGAKVAEGFIMSNEFLAKAMTNEEFVKIMYRAFFGREADEGGLATWKGSLDEGYMKKFVFAGFANSNEFKALCDTYGIDCGVINLTLAEKTPNLSEQDFNIWQFVERLYSEVMGRNPDQTGMDTWVGVLKNGTYTGAKVAEGFILSDEFLNKDMANEEFVKIMYRAFFNRDADSAGFETWTNALETGWTKEAVFAGFANSAKFGRICDEYGIIQGSVVAE